MKEYFYLITHHSTKGNRLYAQQLGGKSSTGEITITYWAEHASRFLTFKEACIFKKQVRLVYPTKDWTVEKYLMEAESLSWAHLKGTPKEPPCYKDEMNLNEEYQKLTSKDISEINEAYEEQQNSFDTEVVENKLLDNETLM